MIDVSVVVPVYNAELYLPQCIDSLVHQTLRNVEFIFVDDGSTDRSAEIIEDRQKQDARITLLRQSNQYAGAARNNGMRAASGKYMIFLDADDFFEKDMLEETFRCAEENRAEIVFFGYYTYDNQTGAIRAAPFHIPRPGVFSPASLGVELFRAFLDAPWNKLFLRSFLTEKQLTFQNIRKHNDVAFSMAALALADRIVCLDRRFVYYRINNEKSLQGTPEFKYLYIIQCYLGLKDTLIRNGVFAGDVKKAYACVVAGSVVLRAGENTAFLLSKDFYRDMKRALIPQLFDAPEDFRDTPLLRFLYESADYDDYVRLVVEEQRQTIAALEQKLSALEADRVSRSCREYRLGRALLVLPRAVRRLLKRLFGNKANQA